ncbi:XRE family transcriptional regulator [Aromatoleum toluolicum]|uniref:XRE family transcriptional regulator n=1 Tax=Aromatoleum toluolicum TaxID=90060 RepID=A0ABX1NNF3_9RHOO|nr:helix-turn-helix domain-containing protein [Aromatoleum toluolicum]NMG00894.1 XRE family transcriptional regulator [Aromatoleum toluolicum]
MTTPTSPAKPRKQPALRFKTGDDVREMRKKLGLNQAEFWSRLSVTQSGGSRYESGRSIPGPVRLLLHMTYGTEKQAADLLAWLRGMG